MEQHALSSLICMTDAILGQRNSQCLSRGEPFLMIPYEHFLGTGPPLTLCNHVSLRVIIRRPGERAGKAAEDAISDGQRREQRNVDRMVTVPTTGRLPRNSARRCNDKAGAEHARHHDPRGWRHPQGRGRKHSKPEHEAAGPALCSHVRSIFARSGPRGRRVASITRHGVFVTSETP